MLKHQTSSGQTRTMYVIPGSVFFVVFSCVILGAHTAPAFINPSGSATYPLDENLADSDIVTAVASGSNPIYSIFSQSPSSPAFTIVSTTTGVLKSPSVDYEASASFTIVLRVTDDTGDTDDVTLTVNIIDLNDNSPIFSNTPYNVDLIVTEATSGKSLVTVAATDADGTSPNNQVTLALTAGNSGGHFDFNAGTGVVSVSNTFSLTAGDSATLTVTATDGGSSPQSTTTTVTISVIADPCSPNPCQNSGTCAVSGATYACTCTSSWTGSTCSEESEDSNAVKIQPFKFKVLLCFIVLSRFL